MDIFSLALAIFLIANPIGNIPAIVAITKDFSFERQKRIVLREGIFALLIAIGFQFVGERFLRLLEIQEYTVSIGGGMLLLLLALQMIFPKAGNAEMASLKKEPFVVPIACPIITGGGVMSAIMLYSSLIGNWLTMTGAILLAWAAILPIMLSGPYLQKLVGRQGLKVLEQLMGLLLALLSTELIVNGAAIFLEVTQ